MSDIKAFIWKHPVLTFCALTFAISWGAILIAFSIGGSPANEEQGATLLIISYIAMIAGPAVAAMVMTGALDGRAGYRGLLSRLLKWRVGARWYAIALLIGPLVLAATLLTLSLFSPDFLPRLYTESDRGSLIMFSLVSALMVAIFEELGWTGFLTPRVRRQYGTVQSGLIVGVIYAAWNFPVVYWVSSFTGTAGSLPMVIFLPAALFTWLPTYRVLMVWVYDHTESLLLAILMHASLITFWTALTPPTAVGADLVSCYLLFTAAMWVVIIALMRLQAPGRSVQGDPAVGMPSHK